MTKKNEKMTLPQLKKLMNENFVPSSLQVISFMELRNKFNAFNITDIEFQGVCKAIHFELFGTSGVWAKLK